jgi:glycosyltransferase involved in cell wall biosynthesis
VRILVIAPQPFFIERGTPIAIDLLLRALASRGETVDLLTYADGEGRAYPGLTIHRIPRLPGTTEVPPGFSRRKVWCDLLLLLAALRLAFTRRYDLVHAGEEAVFIAWLLRRLRGLPYVYDMDSNLVEQMTTKHPHIFGRVSGLLSRWEGWAVRPALAVVPVCDALAASVAVHQPRRVVVLRDVSLLEGGDPAPDLRRELGIAGPLALYVGNLERYQGIDLLLASLAHVPVGQVVVIGGRAEDVAAYRRRAADLGLAGRVHLLGPRPLAQLAGYLAQADVLLSPRLTGGNTPMKIYSYLHAGRAILATDLDTHTQALDERVAVLAAPEPAAFGAALAALLADPARRAALGAAARQRAMTRHTWPVYCATLNALYDDLAADLGLTSPPSLNAPPPEIEHHAA